jgi:hypothetical protein
MGWLGILAEIAGSRIGQIVMVAIVSYGLGWARTDHSWREWTKQQQAAAEVLHQVELAREAQNAVEIAKAATERVEDDEAELAKLRQQVADFDKGEANAKDPCLMDSRLIGASDRMRQPAPSRRHPKLTRPSK